jgi:hypothetical protein
MKGIQIGKEVVKLSIFAGDITLKPEKFHPKTPRYHKQIQQSNSIQNQLTKISIFSIHQQ